MKEFLVKQVDKWNLQLLDSYTEENSYCVAVPSGADVAVSHKNGNIYFWKDNGLTNWVKKELDFLGRDNGWYECNSSKLTTLDEFINELVGDAEIIWQRSETECLMQDKPDIKHMNGCATGKTEYLNETCAGIKKVRQDAVNHPKHYTSDVSGIECIEVTRHRNFNIGNAIKYLWRNGLKDSDTQVQDLEKAVWYIQDEIKRLSE